MLNATLCSLPLLTALDSTVSTWKSLPSAFAPKSRQRDSNSLGRFESVPACKVAMASQKPAICIHLVTSTRPCKITTIELAWSTAQHVRSSFTHFPTCPQYRLMIIAEHGCTELSILLATCHVAKWYCMNCILEVRWPGSRMPHRYVLRTPLFRDTTETPSRLQSSSLPSKPVNGSSTHMALQNHGKCTTPTQLKFNYHMTSPCQFSKKNNFQCHSINLSWHQWIFLSFFMACEFCQLPQFCTSKSFSLSSTQGAESILAHQNLLDDTVDRWNLAKPLLSLEYLIMNRIFLQGGVHLRSFRSSRNHQQYLPSNKKIQEAPASINWRRRSAMSIGQRRPENKKQKSDYKTREMKKYDTITQEKLIHKIRI